MNTRRLTSIFRQREGRSTFDVGCDVTIAIAAITNPDDVIVCVSDRMIPFGDVFQADDNAIVKAIRLHEQWTGAWATNKLDVILPIVEEGRRHLDAKVQWELGGEAAEALADAYLDITHKEFVATHLSRFGYKTIHEFRTQGRVDLGDHFTDLCIELGRFDLGAGFLLFGHDRQKHGKLFEIESPGHVIDRNALKYGVIGSGHDMALASLRRRPLNFLLENTIYRLLEAKFSAETATGVGKPTTVALRNRDGRIALLPRHEIDAVRAIWEETVKQADPCEAIKIVEQSRAVADHSAIVNQR